MVVELEALDLRDVCVGVLLLKKLVPEILSQSKGNVVSRWQHEAVE